MPKRVLLFVMIALLAACRQPVKYGDSLSAGDSLKKNATQFLLDHMMDQTSEIPVFRKWIFGKPVDIRLDTITSDSSLLSVLKTNGLSYTTKTIPDNEVVDESLLAENIDMAIQSLQLHPWSKDIPEDVFLNYLLPYKVYGEQPGRWRKYFNDRYSGMIQRYLTWKNPSLNELYYTILLKDLGKWFHYDSPMVHMAHYSGFDELMAIRKGDCYRWGYLDVYIFRSMGIPAALDFIPQWGSINGGHAHMVFWEPQWGKFRTAKGREFKHPAKVFRYSFQNQRLWTDSIQPVTGRHFMLEQLKHDHWTDATADHTHVTDVIYTLPDSARAPFAYICVFNYGQWKPVYWGRTGNRNQVRFPAMGCSMLYRVAVPQGKKYILLNDIFMVDSTAHIQRLIPDETNLQNMKLQKINHGERSWVEAGKSYGLYMLERDAGWRLLQTKTCQRDSLIRFDHVPANALYRLLEDTGENRLERIFTYNDQQNWW